MANALSLILRQVLARFVVGQSEQAKPIPTIDFAGNIIYDPATGIPIQIDPRTISGYTVGTIQWDLDRGR